MSDFYPLISQWYRRNHRILPWRLTEDPYKIWLSEIIMQQTRVDQGLAYYNKFVEHYPEVSDLAAADEQEVLRLWQGLGYYSRARNLCFAAQQVVDEFDGIFPSRFEDIKSLKGVGDYTASAIASFAFQLPHAVVDGNAFRVLSRYFNDDTPIDTGQGMKVFKAYADEVLSVENPAESNQAIMELGAMVCKPKNPDCENCPLNGTCLSLKEGDPKTLPVKSKKIKVTKRYFHFLIFPSANVQLEKREGKGIWMNMYQFPMIELKEKKLKSEVSAIVKSEYDLDLGTKIFAEKHILTHQHIYATFWKVNKPVEKEGLIESNLVGLDQYPLPRLIERFLENYSEVFSD
ncbi:A/G-specific adenine glycosylase [Brumimicrobium aurantiacum]|uniref:Adenine DNA glycosylase n=1 Tax=Brumimicrobium aurantiacum TaxID=1737063 RepID=A0A3E1F0P3_9FLAO|nr:A/G-specific adenine glycosylase [Brumimicrobium aurantiacum]RFC55378.1 A/G-specific adenine glycosylase [Brumimicrobium aurantiacum]